MPPRRRPTASGVSSAAAPGYNGLAMPLPILHASYVPGPDDLVRFFHRTELHWTRSLAEETQLDVGTAFTNPDLPDVHDANYIRDAALPAEISPAEAVAQVERYFASRGVRCAYWVVNPSAEAERTGPLVTYLLEQGHEADSTDILYLRQMPQHKVVEVGGLKIIPARAALRHTRALFEEAVTELYPGGPVAQLVERNMLELDDPSWEVLIALKDSRAIAHVKVLSVGEIGRIEHLHVAPAHRRQGIGRTMMSRAIEICARSLFKHIFLSVSPENREAAALYEALGFERIGAITAYHARPD